MALIDSSLGISRISLHLNKRHNLTFFEKVKLQKLFISKDCYFFWSKYLSGKVPNLQVKRILGPELDLVVEFLDFGNLDIVSWWNCQNMYEYLNFPRLWFTVQLPPYILGQVCKA